MSSTCIVRLTGASLSVYTDISDLNALLHIQPLGFS